MKRCESRSSARVDSLFGNNKETEMKSNLHFVMYQVMLQNKYDSLRTDVIFGVPNRTAA
jgi:hypothetical protein